MKTREQVIKALTDVYFAKFCTEGKGLIFAGYDEAKRQYYVRGSHLPPSPTLQATYPNGWEMLTYIPRLEAQKMSQGR